VWIQGAIAALALVVGATVGVSPQVLAAEPNGADKPQGPYAVIVGVGEFKDGAIKPRPTADADAKALHALLTDPKYLGVAPDRAKLLTSSVATREAVVKAIDLAFASTGPNDRVIIAFFGRGTSAADKPCFFTADSTVKDRAKTALQVTDLEPAFKKLKKQDLVFLMDVQYKGGIEAGTEKIVEPNVSDYLKLVFGEKDEDNALTPNRMLVLGNTPNQDTLTKGDHGLFYSVLSDGLGGKADRAPYREGYESDGLVSAKELAAYLEAEIPNAARTIGKTDKEKQLIPVVLGSASSKFWITYDPEEAPKAKKRIKAIEALAKDGKLTPDLEKEAVGLLFRMPKLKWQQELRKDYQKLADGGTVADLETARKTLLEGLKLPPSEADEFVKRVWPAIDELNRKYIRPVSKGELAAFAIRGLFTEADEPLPADIADAIKTPKELTEARGKELLAAARTWLGKREDLDGVKGADVTLHAMLNPGLNDPHTLYFDREEWISFSKQLEGRFPGVGIIIRRESVRDGLLVVTPIKGSPAFKAGIQTGDLITEVRLEVDKFGKPLPDDAQKVFSTKGMKTDDAVKLITGTPETPVSLVVEREGEKDPKVFRILRNYVMVETIYGVVRDKNMEWSYYLDPDQKIGYIHIDGFLFPQGDLGTYPDLKRALAQLKKTGLNGLVIDVRNNPGGSLAAVVEMCELFVGKEDIVTTKERDSSQDYTYRGQQNGDKSYPIVILINGFSASASEILAACLQDHGRATVIGERSFGKGSVQRVRPYPLTEGRLKYTDARYYPPSGRNIDKVAAEQDPTLKQRDEWGVKPDAGFEVKLTREERVEWMEHVRDLPNIPVPGKPAPRVDPAKDKQLQKAVEHLKTLIKK
jgi:C-terminal peptidase prc